MSKKSCLMCNVIRDLARFVIAILVLPITLAVMLIGILLFKFLDFLTCDNFSEHMLEEVKIVYKVFWLWVTFRGEDC